MSKVNSNALMRLGGGILGLVVLLVCLIAFNVIVGAVRMRADLTEDKLYTLSDGTRNVLTSLGNTNVTLKLFFNRSSPEVDVGLKNYADQVEDLLEEYRIAGKNVTIEIYDPEPDTDEEEWAQQYGLTPQSRRAFAPPVYFGLVAAVGKGEGAIPALDQRQQHLLEYQITRLIWRIANPKRPKVGVISTLPVLGSQAPQFNMMQQQPRQRPWLVFDELRSDYDITEIPTTAETIEDVDALIVVHPKELSDKLQFAIDQFILGGGKALIMVDPSSREDVQTRPGQQFAMPSPGSDLPKLLSAWGVKYDASKVLVDPRAVTSLRNPKNGSVEESSVFLSLGSGNVNHKEIVTAQLGSLLMPLAGTFSDATAEDLTYTPLVSSSKSSTLVSAMSANFGENAVRQAMRSEPRPIGIVATNLAVRLDGTFKTAFPDGPPKDTDDKKKDEEKPEEKPTFLKEGKSTVFLIGDTDMFHDSACVQRTLFGIQPFNDNLFLLANAVEQITGSAELIGIRSRGEFRRPFDYVDKIEEAARDREQVKEDELVKKLEDTQKQLNELQQGKQASQRFILSPEQKEAIAKFTKEKNKFSKELRELKKNRRRDIETLGFWVKSINIALMPLLVSLAGVCYGILRAKR